MARTRKTPDASSEFEDALTFREVGAGMALEEIRAAVIDHNTRLITGEALTRDYARKASYNVYCLYARICLSDTGESIVDGWLKDAKTEVKKRAKLSTKVARIAWPKDIDENHQRATDAAKVLVAAHAHFNPQTAEALPTCADYLAWVENEGGLDAVRKRKAGNGKTPKPSTEDVTKARYKAVHESSQMASLSLVPKGALNGEIVIFYGVVQGAQTSLRRAVRVRSDGTSYANPNALPMVAVLKDGAELIPHGMGPRVEMVSANSARTASEVLDQAAAQAS